MATKLRLTRRGKKKQPTYRVVAIDAKFPRDGRFIEIVGFYDPRKEPSEIRIDSEKALKWLRNGAQPSERVKKLLIATGVWEEFKGKVQTPQKKIASKAAQEESQSQEPAKPEELKAEPEKETAAAVPQEAQEQEQAEAETAPESEMDLPKEPEQEQTDEQ